MRSQSLLNLIYAQPEFAKFNICAAEFAKFNMCAARYLPKFNICAARVF